MMNNLRNCFMFMLVVLSMTVVLPLTMAESTNAIIPDSNDPLLSNPNENIGQPIAQNYAASLGDPAQVRKMMDDVKNTPIPPLRKNESQPHYSIKQQFSLVDQDKGLPNNLPLGSIVQLSKNGKAQVFDETGKQIFTVESDKATLVQTPQGIAMATQVFRIPNASIITGKDDVTFVIHDNKRILTVISEKTDNSDVNFNSDLTLTSVNPGNDQWIEWDESDPLYHVSEFNATWNVPPIPNNFSTSQGHVSSNAAWIGLEKPGKLIQPVLAWNYLEDLNGSAPPPKWEMATWYNVGDGFFNSDPVDGPISGQHVQGVIRVDFGVWQESLRSTDNLSLAASVTFIDTDKFSVYDNQAVITLEGWHESGSPQFNYDYLIGDTVFSNIELIDANGNPINQSGSFWHPNISSYWDIPRFQPLSVYTVGQWPTNLKVILNTHAQNALIPLPDRSILPTDPDNDGIYEDLSGNGAAGFTDVVLFFKNIEWISENEPIPAFDISHNGGIGFKDVILLFDEVSQ